MKYPFITAILLACFTADAFAQVMQPVDEYEALVPFVNLSYTNSTDPIERRVQDALSRMTLAEKCRLCYAQSKFSTPGVPRLGIPEVRYSDGPHGVRAEINWNDWGYAGWNSDSITAYPALTCLAATWNRDLAFHYGYNIGQEARYRRKTVLLGPGVNIYRTPLGGRNFEYMGEDPCLASKMVVPYIAGIQRNGVAACVKHYILNEQEEFRGHVDVKVSDRALHEIYLPPFKAAVEEGKVWTLMGSYNQYLDQHASHNEVLIDQILKGDLNFDGVVITDWGAAHNTDEAIFNGLDVEMGTYTNGLTSEAGDFGYEDYYLGRAYYEKCLRGEVPDSIINDKAARILRLIFRTETSSNHAYPGGRVASDDQLAAARRIADEGIVLLKNASVKIQGKSKDQNSGPLLPIRPGLYRRILVVGENATRSLCMGGGSSELKTKVEISPLQGIRDRFGDKVTIDYAEGYRSGGAHYGRIEPIDDSVYDQLRSEAVAKAREADLVIYVGGLNKNHFSDCEGGDRLTFDLDFHQNELIEALAEANPRMVCVIISGNAFRMPWLSRVPALLQSWYLGSMAGAALADILSGDVCPSGKTIFTYPVSLADCPAHQLGRVSYPGVRPDEVPDAWRYRPDRNPRSADLLAIAAKSPSALRDAARNFDPSLKVLNTSSNPATHQGAGDEVEVYAEDILVGYRWYDYHKLNGVGTSSVLFPFGYGLSYTTFEYSKPTVYAGTVSVEVTNVGTVEGQEVVQFYVTDEKSSVIRPRKELKYFQKVNLKPGEHKVVSYFVDTDDLSFWDEEEGCWKYESGDFTIYVGSSSVDIRGKVEITR